MATGFLVHWKRLFESYLHPRGLSSTLASPFLLKVCDFVSQSLIVCVHAKSLLSRTILCNTVNCSLPDSSVHGILQARILEWVSMPSSRGSSQFRVRTHVSNISCISRWVLVPPWKPYMQSTSCETPSWINHRLEPRLLGEISTTSAIQMIPL